MFAALETALAEAIAEHQPDDVNVIRGPTRPPNSTSKSFVGVSLSRIETLTAQSSADSAKGRHEPVYATTRLIFKDPQQASITLPDDKHEDVFELQSPPGKWLRRGDDFYIEERTIHFYRAPQAAVVVLLRGKETGGYRERAPAELFLTMTSWGEGIEQSDAMNATAIRAALLTLSQLDVTETDMGSGFFARLENIRASLRNVTRSVEEIEQKQWFRAIVVVSICGDIVFELVRDESHAKGRIKEIVIKSAQ